MTNLALTIGWTLCVFVVLLEAAIIYLVLRGHIDLSRLISEPNGDASMSRFQLLVFTFVVTLCLFLIVAGHPTAPAFPDIPGSVLALLGISASSYTVSKAIQFSSADGVQERPAEIQLVPGSRTLSLGESYQFTATIIRSEETELKWSVVPGLGTIDSNGNYRAPSDLQQDHVYVQVRASLVNNPDVFGAASVVVTKGNVPVHA
jgi:hypothetical protein